MYQRDYECSSAGGILMITVKLTGVRVALNAVGGLFP